MNETMVTVKPAKTLVALKPLTSVRFFAALAVFCSHLHFFKAEQYPQLNWIYHRFFYEGYLGVTFFFVLSGFILTYNYYDKICTLDRRELKKFYVARFARIYPVHFLTFLISLPLLYQAWWYFPWSTAKKAVINVLLLQSFVPLPQVYFSFNEPSWSLCNEFFFYALMPGILFILLVWWRPVALRSLIALGVGVWGFTFIVVFALRDIASSHWLFYIGPPFRLLDFTLGVIGGLIFLRWRDVQLPPWLWSALEVGAVLAFMAQIYWAHHIHQSFRYGVYYMPLFSLIILLFAYQQGIISRCLSHDKLILLGDMSFSFYMFHQLVLRYIDLFSQKSLGWKCFPLLTSAGAFLITLLLSYVCFKYFEQSMRETIRKRL